MHLHSHRLPFELVLTTLAAIALALGAAYGLQLWQAPLYKGADRGSFGDVMALYVVLPIISILFSMGNITLFALVRMGLIGRINKKHPIVLCVVMFLTWIIMLVFWGHCHVATGTHPADPWNGKGPPPNITYNHIIPLNISNWRPSENMTDFPYSRNGSLPRHINTIFLCKQAKVKRDYGDFIDGVDRKLGNLMLAAGVFVTIAYLGYICFEVCTYPPPSEDTAPPVYGL